MGAWPLVATIQMAFVTCCHEGCSVTFGMPEKMYDDRKRDHSWFYCPNGHQQHFLQKTEAEKLKDQIAELEKRNQNLVKREEWARQEAKVHERAAKVQLSHTKRAVTISRKLRQRLKTGTCPCCEEKFDNLEAHMKAEHPRYR